MRILIALVALLSCSCASVLSDLALGYERGRANLLKKEDDGIAYLERRPDGLRPGEYDKAAGVVVMLHGFAGNKDHWTFLAASMPEEYWLIAPDMPGNGENAKDTTLRYDLPSQVKRLHDFLHARGIKRFHLVGNSLGGETAAFYALLYPEDLRSVALLDPAGIDKKLQHAHVIEKPEDFDKLIADSFAHPPPIPGILRDYFAAEAVAGSTFAKKLMSDAMSNDADLPNRVPDIKTPALVVWGDKDKLIEPAAALEWREKIPSHLVVMMPDTGHAPMVERPAETAELLIVWWSTLGR